MYDRPTKDSNMTLRIFTVSVLALAVAAIALAVYVSPYLPIAPQ